MSYKFSQPNVVGSNDWLVILGEVNTRWCGHSSIKNEFTSHVYWVLDLWLDRSSNFHYPLVD